jgi:ferric-dicitrate binding protein FerR (iron transport regulator)
VIDPSTKLARAIHAARETFPGPEPDEGALQGELDALFTKIEKPVPRVRRWPILLAAALMFSVLAIVVAWPRQITFAVEGGGVAEGPYVRTTDRAATIVFSDSSEISVHSQSNVRIVDRTSHGAHLILENGTLEAHVVHESKTDWTIGAGPYEVHVVGTRFEVEWHAETGSFDVRVTEGTVRLTGPTTDALVSAPQGFHVASQVVAIPTAPVLFPAEEVVDSGVTAPTPSVAPKPTIPWSARVAKGEFQAVVDEAEQRGESDTLSHASASDLAALADAARYTPGKIDLAKRALEAERTRFPKTTNATFLLGKIAEDTDHAPAKAIEYYDAYLAETASGAYAQECLGRKMSLERKSDPQSAKTSAARYLRDYPNGSYAGVAREILRP